MSPTTARPAVPGRPCSAAAALQVVGEKWALLAMREILYGNHRFDVIARNTGAPRDRLTARLRALEEAGVIERRAYSERPPRYEYHPTAAGRDLTEVLRALVRWGDTWVLDEPPVSFRHHDHPFDPVETCRTCGETVAEGTLSLTLNTPDWDHAGPVG
ncbi:winged helix-turn-helix transcriptional regulator [Streptomyces sp. NPDC088354]|uniref:winged helix-turn-helix transcriptional regulator n=1 Tax=unclassified Streptomyces TaxID=2593676 RepID=UPI0029AECACB|nr:helix-turn-helix domain-containing protein [Streptomyces sp. MI02-7b]MDX3071766.1 helix-turn-helix domain-containing protein [Streptomyces sp. MI02-7b]